MTSYWNPWWRLGIPHVKKPIYGDFKDNHQVLCHRPSSNIRKKKTIPKITTKITMIFINMASTIPKIGFPPWHLGAASPANRTSPSWAASTTAYAAAKRHMGFFGANALSGDQEKRLQKKTEQYYYYPLVSIQKTMDNQSPFFKYVNQLSMAMFNSYVELPEGTHKLMEFN